MFEASIYNGFCGTIDIGADTDVALGYCECGAPFQKLDECTMQSATVQCGTTALAKGGTEYSFLLDSDSKQSKLSNKYRKKLTLELYHTCHYLF